MILPCIDLMDGKVVQLVQGKEKALEGEAPEVMLEKFAGFPEIQVIDLDAAFGRGENDAIVEALCARARTPERAEKLVEQGAHRVIVGTSAFRADGPNHALLSEMVAAVGQDKLLIAMDSKGGRITVKGWTESLNFTAEELVSQLEPYCSGFLCTYVDKEGMMQGTDLDWFRRLRAAMSPEHELTAAGGVTTLDDVRALQAMNVHAALGMAIYTGRLSLDDLRKML
jgi:phosphoribosylformimino-5-aminoimidazole carboxamide ribonucleotide (ProFAR) isomerase